MATSDSQTTAIWQRAVRRYEEVADKKLNDPALRCISTVDQLSAAVYDENSSFEEFRAKRHALFAVLAVVMRPVESIAKIAGEASSAVLPAGQAVFGALVFLIRAAKGVSEKYDAIIELMSSLKVGSHLTWFFPVDFPVSRQYFNL